MKIKAVITGRSMWARVKGKTENDLLRLPFRQAFMFRPGFIRPTKGMKHTHGFYRVLDPLFPLARLLFPKAVLTLAEIGLAMINSVDHGPDKKVLEVPDIELLARR